MFFLLFSFFAWSHNAAFEVEDSIFFFHAGMHVEYKKGASQAVDGYPKATDDLSFPGLERYRTRMVAALNLDAHTIVFFLSRSVFDSSSGSTQFRCCLRDQVSHVCAYIVNSPRYLHFA